MIKRQLIPHPDNPLWMLVPLGGKNGGYAVVDIQDAEEVGKHNWCPTKPAARKYPYAQTGVRNAEGKSTTLTLHRLIAGRAGFGDAPMVDHENRDGLDCRRANLRAASNADNQHNRTRRYDNSSGYKGVCFQAGKWVAQIEADGQRHYLGRFDTAEAARDAYDAAATELHGPFARVNAAAVN